jgi:ABC-type transport system substrate-binding protein
VSIQKVSKEKLLKNKTFDLILVNASVGISPDLSNYFQGNNLAGYNNEEINTIIKDLEVITDELIIKEKYNRLLEIYNSEVPYIGLYFAGETALYNSNVVADVDANWYNVFYNFENWYIKK